MGGVVGGFFVYLFVCFSSIQNCFPLNSNLTPARRYILRISLKLKKSKQLSKTDTKKKYITAYEFQKLFHTSTVNLRNALLGFRQWVDKKFSLLPPSSSRSFSSSVVVGMQVGLYTQKKRAKWRLLNVVEVELPDDRYDHQVTAARGVKRKEEERHKERKKG